MRIANKHSNHMNLRTLILGLFLCFTVGIIAQESTIYNNADKYYAKAEHYFLKEKFVTAQKFYDKAIVAYGHNKTINKIHAEYYAAICALELYNADAEKKISDFIIAHPESPLVNKARLQMGRYKYREKDYDQAVYWFKIVKINRLEKAEREEYHFKNGYSLYREEELGKAKIQFSKIKDVDTRYTSPAIYYYGHIAYEQKNYETALLHLKRLEDDNTFSPIVPYYISQIYYLQRKYDEVIKYAPALLENEGIKRGPEIARTLSESYYHKKQYKEALPYMEQFMDNSDKVKRDDYYLSGYIYYRNENFKNAAEAFEKVTTEDDVLNQNAYYHLADCYLQLNEKKKAASAFQMAAKYDFNKDIQEEALYNYAKLTFELYYSPFNESIDVLNEYIAKYPNTARTDEAYNFLVTAYMNTKNYKSALESLGKIQNKSHDIKRAYQRVAYFRGLELFNNLNYKEAIEKFTMSLQFPMYDRSIMAQCYYWRGEAKYRMEDYNEAIADLKQFILSTGSFELPEYKISHYTLGYSYFKIQGYEEAITWFRKYASIMKSAKEPEVADANNRAADSYFLLRKYWVAIEYYDKAVSLNLYDPDYALYQRSFALGLVDRPNKKIESLKQLTAEFKESPYFDDALYELGKTYLSISDNPSAINSYKKLVDEYPASNYFKKSLVQLGLIYYNTNQNDQAMQMYKRVVAEFKGSSEAQNALIGIKNIYVDMAKVDDYVKYVESLGEYGTISTSEKDSLTYIAAENIYMAGDCEKAQKKLQEYLDKYANGNFSVNANFYLADCYDRTEKEEEAVKAYSYVISKPKSDFTEQALLGAARLNFKLEHYKDALENFIALENSASMKSNLKDARLGILRINYILKDYERAVEAANKVMATEKMPIELIREARYKKAQSYFALAKYDLAIPDYKLLAEDVLNEQGAEANYKLVEIYFNNKELDKAEGEIFNFAEKNCPHQFWLANSFIILADIYLQKDDNFQAKATLQSVIDGYDVADDGVIDMANERLMEIVKAEKESQEIIEEPDSLNFDKTAKPVLDEVKKEEIKTIQEFKDTLKTEQVQKDTIIFSKPVNNQ